MNQALSHSNSLSALFAESIEMFFVPVVQLIRLFRTRHGWWIILTFMTLLIFCIMRETADSEDMRFGLCVAFTPVFAFEFTALAWFFYRVSQIGRQSKIEQTFIKQLSRSVNELLLLASEVVTEDSADEKMEARQLDSILRNCLMFMMARSAASDLPLSLYGQKCEKLATVAQETSARIFEAHRSLSIAIESAQPREQFIKIGHAIANAGNKLDLALSSL